EAAGTGIGEIGGKDRRHAVPVGKAVADADRAVFAGGVLGEGGGGAKQTGKGRGGESGDGAEGVHDAGVFVVLLNGRKIKETVTQTTRERLGFRVAGPDGSGWRRCYRRGRPRGF